MLSVIGEAPVNSITGTTTVDVSVAKNILDETSLSIQSQGWNFNTNYNYKSLSLDSDSKIPLPSNCVKIDANKSIRHINLTIRNGFLYDMEKDIKHQFKYLIFIMKSICNFWDVIRNYYGMKYFIK